MILLKQDNLWPIARFKNYKSGLLCTSIVTIFSILGFLYLNGGNFNISSKVIVTISQNDKGNNIENILKILETNKVNYGYEIIPESAISELLVGFDNTASINKYLSDNNNYAFPVFIEFNYKVYYENDIKNILKDITFNKYVLDNSLSLINIIIYIIYIIFLVFALSICNIFSLKLEKKPIQTMSYYGANNLFLVKILFKKIIFNSILGFILGWFIVLIFLNILNSANVTALNTTDFINFKGINSYFYFIFLLIFILYSQYITVVLVLKKYMRIKNE
tara:strand:- start:409 stop:1239 length:831 start_codon:yes stop_codon:yes gene_type:complete